MSEDFEDEIINEGENEEIKTDDQKLLIDPDLIPDNKIILDSVNLLPNYLEVKTQFKEQVTIITCISLSTQKESKIPIYKDKGINLISGKMYFIPINTNQTSDSYENIKIFNEISTKFDIRSIENGFAAIIPIIHNVILNDDVALCVLWRN